MSNYPNIQAVIDGTVSGHATEWPQLRLELIQLRKENTEAKMIIRWALDWVDAVPSSTPLPTMPGFDRDYVENFLSGEGFKGGRDEVSQL